MIFTQFVDDALGCASYLVGDPGTGDAVVVDPAFAIEQYLDEAEKRDVRIVRAIETHTHADHLSGHGRLALEHGIPVSIHPAADAEYPNDPMPDGTEIALGDILLRCIHTPGHRPEHCCLAVSDRTRGDDPWIVLTGDSLFVGDAARPDLAVEAREGAEGLFHSLRRLVELGDGVEVYPGHVAGSLCGKAMSSKASTTIGFERRFNPALAHDDVALFIAESTGASAPRPPNMERIVELNRGPFVGAQPDAERARCARSGHADSGCAPHRGFRGRPLRRSTQRPRLRHAILDEGGVRARRRAHHHRGIGRGRGRSRHALPALGRPPRHRGLRARRRREALELVSIEQLDALLANGAELIDVREKEERDSGYIAGSRNIPYRLLALGEADLPRDRPIVTICESGPARVDRGEHPRAHGFDAHPVVNGGIDSWVARASRRSSSGAAVADSARSREATSRPRGHTRVAPTSR